MARSRERRSALRSAPLRRQRPASSRCWQFPVSAIGGVAGGLLGALTNAGISEEDAQVFVEGVRRGGTVVAARVPQSEMPRIVPIMNQSAVNLQERSELYRKSGWQSYDPNAVPYTADQVRNERSLHAH
jgi:hypothetical protein